LKDWQGTPATSGYGCVTQHQDMHFVTKNDIK
ncbi:hypothetical protein AC249_AIPGENE23562, partial [Exaiptasia diaphana]